MAFEDLKRWHWVVVGAFVGVGLAYAWASMGVDVESMCASDPATFEQEITRKDSQGRPLVKDIVVHPQETSFEGPVNFVTYKRLAEDNRRPGRVGYWLEKRLVARIPYRPAIPGRVESTDGLTIEKYLAGVKKNNPELSYRYGWWLMPRNAMIIGCAVGMLLIGGVWPTLMDLMIGAGFGKRSEHKDETADRRGPKLQWFKRADSGTRGAATAGAGMSAAEQARLRDVADQYERGLASGAGHGGGGGTAVAEANATDVRKLDGGPVDPVAPMAKPGDDDDIEIKGEYYPVLIHHAKKKDEGGTGKH